MNTYKGVPVQPEVLGELMELRERLASMAENSQNLRAMLDAELQHSTELSELIREMEIAEVATTIAHNADLLERDTSLLNARKRYRELRGVGQFKTAIIIILGLVILCLY